MVTTLESLESERIPCFFATDFFRSKNYDNRMLGVFVMCLYFLDEFRLAILHIFSGHFLIGHSRVKLVCFATEDRKRS